MTQLGGRGIFPYLLTYLTDVLTAIFHSTLFVLLQFSRIVSRIIIFAVFCYQSNSDIQAEMFLI